MSYLSAGLAGSIPLPANLGAVTGMAAMLVVFGVNNNEAIAAVVLYQAIGFLVPLIGGGIAYVFLCDGVFCSMATTTTAMRAPPSDLPAAQPPDNEQGEAMDVFEIEQKETVSREEVARRLRVLADMLSRHNDLEFERGGMHFTVHVPDQVHLKLQVEVESDERELEIELTW